MRAQGLTNVFAQPGVAEFVRQASHIKRPDGRPLIELHALEGDGEGAGNLWRGRRLLSILERCSTPTR